MIVVYWIFFISTAALLADVSYSILTLDHSYAFYLEELKARRVISLDEKKEIVDGYMYEYGILRGLIKVFVPFIWCIGVFTNFFWILIVTLALKVSFRTINQNNDITKVQYFFRTAVYFLIYSQILFNIGQYI